MVLSRSGDPPKATTCLIRLELVNAKASPVTTKTVSMSATWRLVTASWHSVARSVMLRIPRRMADALASRAKSTVRPEYR